MNPDDPRHGTPAGYQAHRKAGETPCRTCKDAQNVYMARYRAQRGRSYEREKATNRARIRALWRLSKLHPAQFAALVDDEYRAEGIL